MNLLILGGTVFVGRHLTEAALLRGHRVTLLHRGQRGGDLFPGVERILTDRDGPLTELEGRTWDAVVDVSGYLPRVVGLSAEKLRNSVSRYLFVSTISVYAPDFPTGGDESAPLIELEDPTVEAVTGETYGGLKVLCERAVTASLGDRATIVRPGLIAGPYDATHRFPYWIGRAQAGGEVLVPAVREAALSQIDARDLAGLCLNLLERDEPLTLNATGIPTTFSETMDEVFRLNPDARPVEVPVETLAQRGVELWADLPLATPPGSDQLMKLFPSRAIAEGLRHRPLSETVADTAAWWAEEPTDAPRRAGMTRDRELEVLTALRAGSN